MIYKKLIDLSDLQLDAGSPVVIGDKLAGVVSQTLGVSGEYILFVPLFNIKRYWRTSHYAHLLTEIEANG